MNIFNWLFGHRKETEREKTEKMLAEIQKKAESFQQQTANDHDRSNLPLIEVGELDPCEFVNALLNADGMKLEPIPDKNISITGFTPPTVEDPWKGTRE